MSDDKNEIQPTDLECDDCGLATPDVKETVCPFAREIYYQDVKAFLCDHCYHERGMNI